MPASDPPASDAAAVAATLGELPDPLRRQEWLEARPALHTAALAVALAEEATRLARIDLARAEAMAECGAWLAARLRDPHASARAARAAAHVDALRGRFGRALDGYAAAIHLFGTTGDLLERAITQSGALQTLIYQGRYDEALAWASEARGIFEERHDPVRLARLDTNVGNILYRQDRFAEAHARYQAALERFETDGSPQDVAIALRNLAVCKISLHAFEEALETYRDARAWCERHALAGLVAEADYNIAYLYFLKGDYTRAIELYQLARERCEASGDRYHAALCDLDQAELTLELNLVDEGAELARRAAAAFRALGMGYELAKALVNQAVAESVRGRPLRAVAGFRRARRVFVREGNAVWPALIDLHLALLLETRAPAEALRLAEAARQFFETTSLVTKRALAELLLARLDLRAARLDSAHRRSRAALDRLERADVPALVCQAAFTVGQVEEARGNGDAAMRAYRRAHQTLEDLRSRLRRDELKIAFLEDKQAIFEALVALSLSGDGSGGAESAFSWIEQAKSRTLADQIATHVQRLPAPMMLPPQTAARLRTLREQLHGQQREIEDLERRGAAGGRLPGLRREARRVEGELVMLLHEIDGGPAGLSQLNADGTVTLDALRRSLPVGARLVEYYQARGTLYAAVVGGDVLVVVPLGEASAVRRTLRLLQFQLSKFATGRRRRAMAASEAATRAHLRTLYTALIAPLDALLEGASHLVIVPHQLLHYLPFHALHDGSRFLVDRVSLSYAPSASVLHHCRTRSASFEERSLVLGLEDELTPAIPGEVEAVTSCLPNPTLLTGGEASEAALRERGRSSRFVHIATHGLFREDSPMFSAIRLGDRYVTLFDLHQLRLSAELVTLSGCGTGLNVVVGGDELLGLTRGLLFAGAHAVLVTLWDVHDATTALFMRAFYGRARTAANKAQALGDAIRDIRADHPHPYFWAPFVLVGQFETPPARPAAVEPT